jgi:hypothetical protein
MALACAVDPAAFSEPLEQLGLAPAVLDDVASVLEPDVVDPPALLPLEEQAASATALARRPATMPTR